jgi:hypothetical protein
LTDIGFRIVWFSLGLGFIIKSILGRLVFFLDDIGLMIEFNQSTSETKIIVIPLASQSKTALFYNGSISRNNGK